MTEEEGPCISIYEAFQSKKMYPIVEYKKKVIGQLIFSHSSNVSQLIRQVPSDDEGILIDVLLSTL